MRTVEHDQLYPWSIQAESWDGEVVWRPINLQTGEKRCAFKAYFHAEWYIKRHLSTTKEAA